MMSADPAQQRETVLRPLTGLVDDRPAPSDVTTVGRAGLRANSLARLAHAGLPVGPAWLLDNRHFDAFVKKFLPRKHDLATLIALAGRRRAEARCALAYERLMSAPVARYVFAAVEQLLARRAADLPLGLTLDASLIAKGNKDIEARPRLAPLRGLKTAGEVVDGIRRIWACAVLHHAVCDYAAAELTDVGLAIVVTRTAATDRLGFLVSANTPRPGSEASAHLVVPYRSGSPHDGASSHPRPYLWIALAGDENRAATSPQTPLVAPTAQQLADLQQSLGTDGYRRLADIATVAGEQLGPSFVLQLAWQAAESTTERFSISGASPRLNGRLLSTHRANGVWCELDLATSGERFPTVLNQSLADDFTKAALGALLRSLRCKLGRRDPMLASCCGRSYLNVSGLSRALEALPLVDGVMLDQALGLGGRLIHENDANREQPRRWRQPLVAAAAITEGWRFENEAKQLRHGLSGDLSTLAEMDLSLLPNDGIAETLTNAQSLVERAVELWLRSAAVQLLHQRTLRAVAARRVSDSATMLGAALSAGVPELFCPSMGIAVGRVALRLAASPADVAQLKSAPNKPLTALSNSSLRGEVGGLFEQFGALCFDPFDLRRSRWRDDPHELTTMLAALAEQPAAAEQLASVIGGARAGAEAELGRFEPYLRRYEKRAVRQLIDRCRHMARLRTAIDRQVYTSLALLREVLIDIDRRLRRSEPGSPRGGVFHCSVARLVTALTSGRPELVRIIAMRQEQRRLQQQLEPPSRCFRGSPPLAPPRPPDQPLAGTGISPGVVEGHARVIRDGRCADLRRGDIVVQPRADAALAPAYLLAGALVSEAGGPLELAAEVAREYALPAVFGCPYATQLIRDGQRLRVDGAHGTVQIL